MMTLNNPFPLVSLKLLGIGLQVDFDHVDGQKRLVLTLEAVAWNYSKGWALG